MEYVILIGVIVFFVLKKIFLKYNPIFAKKKINGLFVLPLLLLVDMVCEQVSAISLEPLNSENIFNATGILLQGGNDRIAYEGAIDLHKGITNFCFFIVLCCSGLSLYKIFNYKSFRATIVKTAIGIASVATIVSYLSNILFQYFVRNYFSSSVAMTPSSRTSIETVFDELLYISWGVLIVGIVILAIS